MVKKNSFLIDLNLSQFGYKISRIRASYAKKNQPIWLKKEQT